MVSTKEPKVHVNCNYIDELQGKFQDVKFERTEKLKIDTLLVLVIKAH